VKIDTDGDGIIDTIFIDEDGDGVADIKLTDTTGDGSFDSKEELPQEQDVQHMKDMYSHMGTEDREGAIRKLIPAMLDSFPMILLVISLVVLQVYLIEEGKSSQAFEIFTTVFFTLEVSMKLWALGWHSFRVRDSYVPWVWTPSVVCSNFWAIKWLNINDLLVVSLDLFILILVTLTSIPGRWEVGGQLLSAGTPTHPQACART
jgi:hypothetical protein